MINPGRFLAQSLTCLFLLAVGTGGQEKPSERTAVDVEVVLHPSGKVIKRSAVPADGVAEFAER